MNLSRLFFPFRGRATRAGFWLVEIVMVPIATFQLVVTDSEAAVLLPDAVVAWASDYEVQLWAAFAVWASLAVQVKRWHDCDKSGWWVLINFLPLVGGLWALIENGFLRGTRGPNRFGGDPRSVGSDRNRLVSCKGDSSENVAGSGILCSRGPFLG